jgi:exopolysaccharide biosynthesis polyprenyl glycosylphosphotransferase
MISLSRDRDAALDRPTLNAGPEVRNGKGRLRALIVGAGAVGRSLAHSLEADGRYEVVGYADDEPGILEQTRGSLLGNRDSVPELVRRYHIDEVFVAYAPTWQQRLVDMLSSDHPSVSVQVVPSAYESSMCLGRVQSRDDIALVQLTNAARPRGESLSRCFDVVAAASALLLLSPALLVVALLTKLLSPGPVIFAQERVGRFGQPFKVLKFRTMVHNAEAATGPVLSSGSVDPRLTAVGRWLRLFRIDEIPQLWNVLRGEMSLVGPRPERPHFVRKYEQMIPAYHKRHQIRPGITGLAQICAGYHTDARDKLRFDLIYASHKSLLLDLSILARTVRVVLKPRARETTEGRQ